jgi:DNA polymerase-1
LRFFDPRQQKVFARALSIEFEYSAGAPVKPLLKRIQAGGAALYRIGTNIDLSPDAPADLRTAFDQHRDQLRNLVVPGVTAIERRAALDLLGDIRIEYITDKHTADQLVATIMASAPDRLAVDTETEVREQYREPVPVAITKTGTIAKLQPKTGVAGYALNPRKARVRLLQVYDGGDVVHLFDMRHVPWAIVAPLLTQVATLVMFNATFDVKMILASGGPEPTGRIYDAMTAMRLVNGTRPSMADAADDLLGIDLPKALGASDWSADQLSLDQLTYAGLDPIVTWELADAQLEQLDDAALNAQEIVDGAIVAVARMELAGMPIDAALHRQMIATWRDQAASSIQLVRNILRLPMGTDLPTDNQVRQWIAASVDADDLAAWPTTEKGALSVARDKLKIHGAGLHGVTELLDAKAWSKALSTYGYGLAERIEGDRLHGSFLIAGARTGRASGSKPNLQNLPKRSAQLADFRKIFAAPPGYVIVTADYSQIELRCLAALSGDAVMTQLYADYGRVHRDAKARKQYDIHTMTARSFSASDEPTSADRSVAKAINFSLAYGSGPTGVRDYAESSYGVRMTRDEAAERIEAFRQQYPGVAAWQRDHEQQTRQQGWVATVGGRKWQFAWRAWGSNDARLDDVENWQIDDKMTGYERNYALNHPVQGTSAEVTWVALDYVDHALRPYDARLVAVVHDELVVVARDDHETVRAVRCILATKMTRAWLEFFHDAPWRGLVEVGQGRTWADAH